MRVSVSNLINLSGMILALVAGVSLGSRALAGKEAAVNPKVVQQAESFTVVGIAGRTTNEKEMTGDGIIGKYWGRLMQEGLLAKIPNKADGNIVAVYTDYASDHDGEYLFLLGARVKGTGEVPAGMVAKTVPAGKYAVFTSEKGPAYQVVPAVWQKINGLPKNVVGGDRVYRADYEVYDERARDPQASVVDVWVGIR
jgi:predicted transcriptional regulator YdeE